MTHHGSTRHAPRQARWALLRSSPARGRAAAGRLRAAQRRFDHSMIALRKAAFDHVERQNDASLAFRAALDRVAPIGMGRSDALEC